MSLENNLLPDDVTSSPPSFLFFYGSIKHGRTGKSDEEAEGSDSIGGKEIEKGGEGGERDSSRLFKYRECAIRSVCCPASEWASEQTTERIKG